MRARWLAVFGLIPLWFCNGLADPVTITYDFNVTWVRANPDNSFERPVVGINGHWPVPQIRATVGDRLIINVLNSLGNETTSLHFHGIYMNGSTEMDGAIGASQCEIPSGASFKYNFTVCSNPIEASFG